MSTTTERAERNRATIRDSSKPIGAALPRVGRLTRGL